MELVKVVIPIYKSTLTHLETKALIQVYKILGAHPLIVIKPESLDLSNLSAQFPKLQFISFEDVCFEGITGYNRLMLSPHFYERFLDTDYILIYQLDAYVFRDELTLWCEKGYDYIGAPWLQRSIYRSPVIAAFMRIKQRIIAKPGKPRKEQLYNKIGNGGLSLRKVSSHYRICIEKQKRIQYYLSHERYHLYNEDVFWAREPEDFIYPTVEEALSFSFDKYPGYCYRLTRNQLPFGCHSWYKRKMKNFWVNYIPFE